MKHATIRLLALMMSLVFLLSTLVVPISGYCNHTSYTDYYSTSKFSGYNNDKHKVTHVFNRTCNYCGKVIKKVNSYEWFEHDFSNSTKCDCGYKKVCKHANYSDLYSTSKFASYDKEQHKIKHIYNRVCSNCNKVIKQVNTYVWANHEFDYNDKCDCGYKKPGCKHSQYTDEYFSSSHVTYNQNKHKIQDVYDRKCNACNKIVKQVNKTRWETHIFNSNGMCGCGYKNPNKKDVEIVSYSVNLDNSQDYVTIKVVGNVETTAITVCLKNSSKAIDSINVQSSSADVKFNIPYSNKEVKYTVMIVAYGKTTSDFVRIDEKFTANNPKTLWNWTTEGIKNLGAMTFGVVSGISNAIAIEPVFILADFFDYGLNLFDQEQYENNKEWRREFKQSVEDFFVDKMTYGESYYYYCGTFGGEMSELLVGGIYVINGIRGIVKNVCTYQGGVKLADVVLENGDEALVMMSDKSDDVAILATKLDDVVDSNKLHHIFEQPKHNLKEFLNSFGGNQEYAYRSLLQETIKYIDNNNITGLFNEIVVDVNGYRITVSGNVIDGIVKIGTAYIP